MASLFPFRALRPRPEYAARIAAVPYDVVDRGEARELAHDNPLSFLRVSRAELELPDDTDPYSAAVYERAASNFAGLEASALVLEAEASVYVYRLRMGSHVQTGVAACFSIDEYDGGVIKKHERTRRDKEDDRTRHMVALRAQTGPVFLTYAAHADIDAAVSSVVSRSPLIDFAAADGVQHTLWRVARAEQDALVRAYADVGTLYIADGHHRAASASRARRELLSKSVEPTAPGDRADVNTMLAVAFPHDQLQVLPYNRVVKDLAGHSPETFLQLVQSSFDVTSGPAAPTGPGEISMFLGSMWYTLRPRVTPDPTDPIESLDVSVLQNDLIAPFLGITDVRTDKRIDFVGGARGTTTLERLVVSGTAAVAFSLFPVGVSDLMSVADAGAIMPPKSTWFEPKLRDGLLIHLI